MMGLLASFQITSLVYKFVIDVTAVRHIVYMFWNCAKNIIKALELNGLSQDLERREL